jgi:hypothetical protein
MVSVRATGPGDWELVRDVRLAALRDAPGAFASSYEREAAYSKEQWRGWFSDRFALFLADLPDRAEPAGLADRRFLTNRRFLLLSDRWGSRRP